MNLLHEAGAANVQLLITSKELNASPKDTSLKARLDSNARQVIEAMKKLLLVCFNFFIFLFIYFLKILILKNKIK